MKKKTRLIRRWLVRLLIVIGVIFGLQLSILAFPYPFFPHKGEYPHCTVYSDVDLPSLFARVMDDVERRITAVELFTAEKDSRVFICRNRRLYSFFARLTLLDPNTQGFNLSIFGNSFISASRVDELRIGRGGMPPYSIVDGGLAHAIAHEIIHEYCVDALGFFTNYRQPYLKKEGYAEYGAHLGAWRDDSAVTLADKVAILRDDSNWHPHDYVRSVYRAALVVEYLSDIKGYRFVDIMNDRLSLDEAYRDMLGYFDARK